MNERPAIPRFWEGSEVVEQSEQHGEIEQDVQLEGSLNGELTLLPFTE